MRFNSLISFSALALTLLGTSACGSVVIIEDDRNKDADDTPSSCGTSGKAVVLSGALGSQPIVQSFAYTGAIQGYGDLSLEFGGTGLITFKGGMLGPGETSSESSHVWLRMPDEAGGAVYCAESGATISQTAPLEDGGVFTTSFTDLKKLGACPGSAVSGDATFCDFGACDHMIEGMIDGISLTLDSSVGSPPEYLLENGGHLTQRSDGGLMIWMPSSGGPENDSVYCVESMDPIPGEQGRYVLGGFSRLGSCSLAGPVGGAVDICAEL